MNDELRLVENDSYDGGGHIPLHGEADFEASETTFLSHLAVPPDDADSLVTMVRAACRNALQRGLDYVMLAAAVRDPVYKAVQRNFSCHSFDSMLYLAYWEDGRTEAGCVDKRIARPEMAIL